MQYRPLGKTGLNVSALGLGCMRFDPEKPELAEQIVDEAIASGINYFETTRGYINGKCQHLTALGLKKRSRGLIVSGKGPVNLDTTADSYYREIVNQMEILGVDYLEFYQAGWFSKEKFELFVKPGGALEGAEKARSEGLIGHLGFTGHDKPENFIKIIETGIFDSCTVVYNIMNRTWEPLLKRAGELGVGVIAMCPVAGGILSQPSEQLKKIITSDVSTTAGAALKFVLSNPNVSCACSGMNTLEQLRENVATVEAFKQPDEKDLARLEAIMDEFAALGRNFCTACGYCKPCPNGVNIPQNFQLLNYAKVYGLVDWAKKSYAQSKPEKRASACIRCGECEPKCPHKIAIMDQLEEVNELLGLS